LNTQLLNIILVVLLAIAVAVVVILIITRHNAANKAVAKSEKRFKRQQRECEDELQRIQVLYNKLKTEKRQTTEPSRQVIKASTAATISADTLFIEQKKLEKEREDITERNKKLWEMSIAIEKEKQHISELKNDIERKHRDVTDSIKYAQRIQLAVIPSKNILKYAFSDYFIFWRPRDIVSGDYYWMKRNGNIIAFTVADCTGHGVPGSFMSLLGATFLNDLCYNLNESTMPSDILEKLRTNIIGALSQHQVENEPKDGMDMSFCILNLDTHLLRWSGANNPLYIIRNQELTEYKPTRNPIGQHPKPHPFETVEIQVEPGDWLYMFSDGYADQFSGETGKKLTYKKFRALLTEICTPESTSEEQSQKLGEFLDNWRGELFQMDDVMVGGYKI